MTDTTRNQIQAAMVKAIAEEIVSKIRCYRAMPLEGYAQQIKDRLDALDVCYPADLDERYLSWLEAKLTNGVK